ncbi:MAG TPA: hypothetical protein V6D19_03035 [Stenomitos sp.]
MPRQRPHPQGDTVVDAGLNKLEAIAKVLGEHRGQTFHEDKIT